MRLVSYRHFEEKNYFLAQQLAQQKGLSMNRATEIEQQIETDRETLSMKTEIIMKHES